MKNLLFVFVLAMGCVSNTSEKPIAEVDSVAGTIVTDSAKTDNSIKTDTATKMFKGAWFDIRYPASFTAKPLKSSTHREESESAFFTSPDGKVSFYVFSPQWSGDATDIKLEPGEKIISKDSSYTPEKRAKTINWTIEASDKSYRRSYQEIKMDENINWIFGIKYKDEAAYNQYKQAYLNFKNSIKQYAD